MSLINKPNSLTTNTTNTTTVLTVIFCLFQMFDIIFFVLIFVVFLFGFGIMFHANIYPNSEPGYKLFKEVIYIPYWQLYGELFLDIFEGND